ncbi:hypothetical protein [Methylococcus capsulatus]|uniref:hypothetical protein n=1 Tax=Methylococcus capsulatus TaxID=414 RepID=UPI00030C5016|nr:hypothetical protein [Methylococcus capsulatus]
MVRWDDAALKFVGTSPVITRVAEAITAAIDTAASNIDTIATGVEIAGSILVAVLAGKGAAAVAAFVGSQARGACAIAAGHRRLRWVFRRATLLELKLSPLDHTFHLCRCAVCQCGGKPTDGGSLGYFGGPGDIRGPAENGHSGRFAAWTDFCLAHIWGLPAPSMNLQQPGPNGAIRHE